MNIELSEEQVLLRDTVRRFAQEVVAPRAKEIDQSGEFPRAFFDQAGELGLAGVAVPEEHGGGGMDTLAYALAIEEVSRACATSGVILSVNNSLVCDPILKFGTEEQKRDFLVPLASGKKLGCFALTEPGAGSDPAGLRTTARRDGDAYVLDGNKVFITNGTDADIALVFATVDLAKKHRGITAFLVHADTPGYHHGEHEFKLGVNASGTTELAFSGMRVPAAQRLGEDGEGFKIAMATLDGGRIGIAAQAVGIAQAAMEEALSYAQQREQFGQASVQLPGHPVLPRGHGDRDRRRAPPHLEGGVEERLGPALQPGGRAGQALRLRDGAAGDQQGAPDPRRLWLHQGVQRRALLSRRPHHRDLRGHQRDPENGDRRLGHQPLVGDGALVILSAAKDLSP